MKKNINDYKRTKTAIEVNSIEEFDKIKKLLGHTKQAPKESFFTETDKMIINGFVMGNGQIFQNNIDSEDIYIIPITKRKKEIQTITIESITNLNLNLKTIKPKQIQTIKI